MDLKRRKTRIIWAIVHEETNMIVKYLTKYQEGWEDMTGFRLDKFILEEEIK